MSHRRARSARSLAAPAALAALAALCSCLSDTSAQNIPPVSITVSNVTTSQCTHQQAGGVVCTIGLDVQLHDASIYDTLVTITTNDTLQQQWLIGALGPDINYGFPNSKLTRSDTGCLRAQDSIYIWDGPSAAYPLIAKTAITPITLTCN